MCGIIGFIGKDEDVKVALRSISYRGIDDEGYYEDENVKFGHCLHSIVGNSKQPLEENEWVFGANCEIYNWRELAKKYNFNVKNDAELLFKLLIHYLRNTTIKENLFNELFDEIDGVFAFFIYNKEEEYLILARDKLGEKPLWFSNNNGLVFCSEKKAIEEYEPEELNPRKILFYKDKVEFFNQEFFKIGNEKFDKEKIKNLLEEAVIKRIPDKKLGLLFSGGLDSALLAKILKNNNKEFIGYLCVSQDKEEEIRKCRNIADEIGFELRIIEVNKEDVEEKLKEIVRLIESADPVKVEVATTLFFALEEAKKDDIKVIFSGVGADDIFIGYKRMLASENLNEDSLSNLRRVYERDLYRDDVISMYNNIELRLPYLDKELVKNVLLIDSKYKKGEEIKPILREIAKDFGLENEFKRSAAQYSSGISKIISNINKNKGKYLLDLYGKKNLKVGALLSSGKDSVYALHILNRLNYDVNCLITIKSLNQDSFMFHTPAIELAKLQAECLELPIVFVETEGEKEKELEDLKKALLEAKEKYKIQGVVSGALFSNYQRTRIEEICDELNLKVYAPLWHMDQEEYMYRLIKEGFKFIFTKVAADGLDKSWLGKVITKEDVDKLVEINKKYGVTLSGEGGCFETLILEAPMFKKKIIIKKAFIEMESECCGIFMIDKIEVNNK